MPYHIEHLWNNVTGSNRPILIDTENGLTWEWDDSQVATHGIGPVWKPIPLQPHGPPPLNPVSPTYSVGVVSTSNAVLLTTLLKRAIVLCRAVMRGYNYQPTDLDALEADAKNAGVVVP